MLQFHCTVFVFWPFIFVDSRVGATPRGRRKYRKKVLTSSYLGSLA